MWSLMTHTPPVDYHGHLDGWIDDLARHEVVYKSLRKYTDYLLALYFSMYRIRGNIVPGGFVTRRKDRINNPGVFGAENPTSFDELTGYIGKVCDIECECNALRIETAIKDENLEDEWDKMITHYTRGLMTSMDEYIEFQYYLSEELMQYYYVYGVI